MNRTGWTPLDDFDGDDDLPAVVRPAVRATRIHQYRSTACVHGKHTLCRQVCKFCPAECDCVCH